MHIFVCIYIHVHVYGRVSLILFSLTCARQVSWPIPLGQPVAHTPGQPVAHTPLAASGPYPWTASGPYQRQPRGPYPRQRRFCHFGFRLESFLIPSGLDPYIFTACLSAPGPSFYFLIRAFLLRFIRASGLVLRK